MGLCLEKNVERDMESKSNSQILQQSPQQIIQQNYEELNSLREQSVDGAFHIKQFKNGKISQDYSFLNPPIGQGLYGEVRKAIHKRTNQMRAIKIIDKQLNDDNLTKMLLKQVQILQKMDHPNIIEFLEFYQDDKYFYLVTELCTGGELFQKIIDLGSFSEESAAETMQQLLASIHYLHQAKIMHREIKPENIVYQSWKNSSQLKLIGFTMASEFIPNQKLRQKVGTPYYIAPEVLDKKYDEKCDIWSLGVILYILLSGYFFKTKNEIPRFKEKMMRKFQGKQNWLKISIDAKELISKMLTYNPEHRYSALQCLQHPWIQKHVNSQKLELSLLKGVLQNVKKFKSGNKIKEAIYYYIIKFFLPKEEIQELSKIYYYMNLNYLCKSTQIDQNNGQKHKQDIFQSIYQLLEKNEYDHQQRKNFSQHQSIDIAWHQKSLFSKLSEHLIKGELTIKEFQNIFQGISVEVWDQIIADVGSSGKISYDQFERMMTIVD